MYIRQFLLTRLQEEDFHQKVCIIYGPRQVGKTTLLEYYLKKEENYLLVSGEDINVRQQLSSESIDRLKLFVGDKTLLVIDEAQKIPNIGLNLKLLIDHCRPLRIIATGSSSFSLAQQVGEPLVGRSVLLQMFPLSQIELNKLENLAQTKARLEERLLYGSYPEVILAQSKEKKIEYLQQLVSAYLYRDILELDRIRNSQKLIKLLQLLAFQIGQEVSLPELGQQLGLDQKTVERYLDLLEKSFVLISISGYSRNLRNEISKRSRYYFYDTGVRNALIQNFNSLDVRNDTGQLWENYVIIERLKKQNYHRIYSNNYFWRTYTQQEIDWVEDHDGFLSGYEMKWNPKAKSVIPSAWKNAYPKAGFQVIHPENYLDFIV